MSLFEELKRRNVVRVGVAYVIIGWVIAQVAEFAFENFGAPEWVLKSVVVLLLLGLPLVLFGAWAFEITPEGVKREKDVDRSQSITPQTGRKLDRTIIGVLVIALVWFAWDKFNAPEQQTVPVVETPFKDISAPDEKSVAVLPFVAMSRGPDDEFFADGLTEEILNSLAQLPELLVTARTSAFSFKGQDIPVQEIADALGVRHIVEGSVRRSGDRLRVTAQLIRAEDGFHLWSENYDSTSTDAITVQESIAEKIATSLDVVLDEDKREAMRKAGLRDVEAFTLYQKALVLYEDAHGEVDTLEGLTLANELFEEVLQRVPTYGQAYLDHSDLYVHILGDQATGLYGGRLDLADEDVLPAAVHDYQQGLRYASSPEMSILAELDLAFISSDWRGISGRIEQALATRTCTDGNWTPIIADLFGYADVALERSYSLIKCDPRWTLSWFTAARYAFRTGDNEEALRLAREGSKVAPGSWLSYQLVNSLIVNGEFEEASRVLENDVRDSFFADSGDLLIAATQGKVEEAMRHRDRLMAREDTADYWGLMANAWVGDREAANAAASRIDKHHFAVAVFAQMNHWCNCGAPFDLEATPNFAAVVEQSNIPWPPVSPLPLPLKDW